MKRRGMLPLILAVVLVSAFLIGRDDLRAKTMAVDGNVPIFILDPGHGGEDGGAVSEDGLTESSVNLSIALRTDDLMGLFGYPCILTRDSEELQYPSQAKTVRQRKQADLERRVKLINSVPNAVLLSIHQNKYTSPGPRGAQVFFRDDLQSIAFSDVVQSVLTVGLGPSVRPSTEISESIYLMRKAECPGILVECGFLSNPGELTLLRSEDYQTKLALCLACACHTYAKEWEISYGQSSES